MGRKVAHCQQLTRYCASNVVHYAVRMREQLSTRRTPEQLDRDSRGLIYRLRVKLKSLMRTRTVAILPVMLAIAVLSAGPLPS
ncbi:MAG TPA: hypothetical protein VH227_05230, partial [Candidatus Udaeobacter sp.]|nr:hypothetical protein [Candidatus Udaeobacter sp.]